MHTWVGGSRWRAVPAAVVERAEQLLDRVVQQAVVAPRDVHDAKQVRAALEAHGKSMTGGRTKWAVTLATKSKRSLPIGRRSVPIAVAAKVGSELASSFRLGGYELELLASLCVQRLRDAHQEVDPRFVQRVTVNAYLNPHRRHDVAVLRPTAAAQLGGMLLGRVMNVEPALGRVTKAAELIESLPMMRI